MKAVTPRILVTGEMVDGATGPALAQGFRQAGWLVQRLDLTRFLPVGGGLLGRARSRIVRTATIRAYNTALQHMALSGSFSVVLLVKGTYVTKSTIARMKQAGALVILFYPDVEFDHPGIDPRLPESCDFVFTSKSFHLSTLTERLGADRVRLLHHGFDPLIHRDMSPASEDGFVRDLVFIGNYSSYKMRFLLALSEQGFEDFAIMGGGWDAASDSRLARHITGRAPHGDDYVWELAHSRVAVALHHGPVRTPGWEDQVSTRSFEIPASGAAMLHVDNAEIRSLFSVGTEIVTFADPDELLEQARYLLDFPAKRRSIATAGHDRAIRCHSYWHRSASMADTIVEIFPSAASRRNDFGRLAK